MATMRQQGVASEPGRRRAAIARLLLAWLLVSLPGAESFAQERTVQRSWVNPQLFGLEVPRGEPRAHPHEQVLVPTAEGPQVARVHVQVGPYLICLLPDGSLAAVHTDRVQPTDEPFRPLDQERLAQQLTQQPPLDGFRVRQTRHFVYVYDSSEPFAVGTGRILESMFPGLVAYAQSQGLATHEPPVPLAVIMFGSREAFEAYRPAPRGVVAYYDVVSNQVVMYEPAELARAEPTLALQEAIATIAHEGAHQILHNIGVQQRLSVWPMWLSEGLAEFFAPTTIDRRLRWKGAGGVNDLRLHELAQHRRRQLGAVDGSAIEQTVTAARLTSTGYAFAWALTHYVARNHRRQFQQLLQEASELGPLERLGEIEQPGVIQANRLQFARHFGSDLAGVERRMLQHLARLPYRDPLAHLPFFVATVLVPEQGRAIRQARGFHDRELAADWQQETLEQLPASRREAAQVAIFEFPNRAVAERFLQQWRATDGR